MQDIERAILARLQQEEGDAAPARALIEAQLRIIGAGGFTAHSEVSNHLQS